MVFLKLVLQSDAGSTFTNLLQVLWKKAGLLKFLIYNKRFMSYNLYETTIFTNIFQDYETDIKYIQTNDSLYLPIN